MKTKASPGFVSGIAWTFIALGALGVLTCAPLAAFFWLLVDPAAYALAIDDAFRASPVPVTPGVRWTVLHLKELLVALALLSLLTLVGAIGLLRRREWARLLFIVLMWVGAVAHVLAAVLPFLAGGMDATAAVLAAVSAIFALAFGALYAWVAIVLSRHVL